MNTSYPVLEEIRTPSAQCCQLCRPVPPSFAKVKFRGGVTSYHSLSLQGKQLRPPLRAALHIKPKPPPSERRASASILRLTSFTAPSKALPIRFDRS